MKAIREEEMKRIDSFTAQNITSSIELMEMAGRKMSDIILESYEFKKVLILAGGGGNGGDAFVVGRYLYENSKDTYIYMASNKLSADTLVNMGLYKGKYIDSLDNITDFDIIVDGLIGIGLHDDLNEKYINIINIVNGLNKPTISLDIPSGINADNGLAMPIAIKSDLCITVEYPKTGLFLNDALDYYKTLKVIDIGIIETNNTISIVNSDMLKGIFKNRLRNSNKGSFKKASIIAGSYKYPGASLIAYNALCAFKMGVGYSKLYVPKELYELYALRYPEIIVNSLSSIDSHIKYNEEELDEIMNSSDSITIGMGMDISIDLYNTIKYLLKNYTKTLIIDADGINTISKYGVDILLDKKCNLIITPHLKEFERLINVKVLDIKKNPLDYAIDFAKKYDLTLLLKSNTSIIASNNNLAINISGNTGLAKGGSGDALSGILVGVCAYLDESIFVKTCAAAFILGRASELCNKHLLEEVMTISNITDYINSAIFELKE